MKIKIDPEFQALIPPLGAEELQQLEANRLGFVGGNSEGDSLTLMPTPIGNLYWIYSYLSLREGVERFSRKPTAVNRLPVKDWLGFMLEPKPMESTWEYPPPYREKANPHCCIYFIQGVDGGPVKIGLATSPTDRLRQLQTASPVELRILRVIEGAVKKDESAIHRKFNHLHIRGEWFSEKVMEELL